MKTKQLISTFILFFSLITAGYAGDNRALQSDAEFDAYHALQSTRQFIFSDLLHNTRNMLPFLPEFGTAVFGVDGVNPGLQHHKADDYSIYANQFRTEVQADG